MRPCGLPVTALLGLSTRVPAGVSSPSPSPHLRSPLHTHGGTGKSCRAPASVWSLGPASGLWRGKASARDVPPPGAPGALPVVLPQAPSHVLRVYWVGLVLTSRGRALRGYRKRTSLGPRNYSDSTGTHTGIGLVPPEPTNIPGSQVYDILNASQQEKQTTRTITFARFSGFDRFEFAS